jgi:hypothetical protein
MDCVDPDLDLRVIDPRFFAEWVAFGMLELAVYLTRYAEFEAYCERRQPHRLNRNRNRAPPSRPGQLHVHYRTRCGAGGNSAATPAPRDHGGVLCGTPRILKIDCRHLETPIPPETLLR